jgi:Ca2+:H+ antiporter
MTADAATPRPQQAAGSSQIPPVSPTATRRISYAPTPTIHPHGHQQPGYTPLLESVDHAIKNTGISPMHLPESMTTDDFTRAVAVATVSALRHQQNHGQSPARARISGLGGDVDIEGGHGGHEAPSWSRTISAAVLLGCTALYAIIAGRPIVEHMGYFMLKFLQRSSWMLSTSFSKAPALMRSS